MNDDVCVNFLRWCLPKLNKQWSGFRRVRGQVCKRIARRMQELEMRSLDAYRAYLDDHPEEWDRLDQMCRITISRFYRDRGVFDALRTPLLPDLAQHVQNRETDTLRAWSAGCASGEEPYTLRIIWQQELFAQIPDVSLHITATDAEAHMLDRAQTACYARGTLKELPEDWINAAFSYDESRDEEPYCLRSEYKQGIQWRQQDIRDGMPDGPFHLILCRNLVFMYFDEDLQRRCLEGMLDRLAPRGLLVLGKHDALPDGTWPLAAWDEHKRIYRYRSNHARM